MKQSQESTLGSVETNTSTIFYQQYRTELERLFDAFGIEDRTLQGALTATQCWAKGDHYAPENAMNLTLAQEQTVQELARSANMLDEVLPPHIPIDRLILLGGEQNSNQSRADWLSTQLTNGACNMRSAASIVALGGNRTLKGREVQSLGQGLSRSDQSDPWLNKQISAEMSEVLTEDAGLRVALLAALGKASLGQMHVRLNTANSRELIQHRLLHSSYGDILAINAPAAQRPLGPPRHTTESSLCEWLSVDTSLKGDETVVLVSSNPYIVRTHRNLQDVIHQVYPHMKIFTCGPAAVQDALIHRRIMGEVTRNLYEDYRHLVTG